MHAKFPHIADSKAGIKLLQDLFKKYELIYNKNNQAKLMDDSKRVYSTSVNKSFSVIESNQLTYQKWRIKSQEFSIMFNITYDIQSRAEHIIRETFEYFKDMKNLEHHEIKQLVGNNDYRYKHIDFESVIEEYVNEAQQKLTLSFDRITTFFTCLCAFVEHYEKDSKK